MPDNGNCEYEFMREYCAEHGVWHLENKGDLFFKTLLDDGAELEGLFWWREGEVAFGGWRYAADQDDWFDDLGNQVSKAKLNQLKAKWRPLATKVLQEINTET